MNVNENTVFNLKKMGDLFRVMNEDWNDSKEGEENVFCVQYRGRSVYIPVTCRTLNAVQHLSDKFSQDVRSQICNELYDFSGGELLPSYTDDLLESGKAFALALWLKEVEEHGAEELTEEAGALRRAIVVMGAAG